MNANNIDRDVLLEYVMGGLTPEREKEVAAYLRQNPDEADWVRDMFEMVADVALDQEPVSVPASAESDLLKRIRKESEAKARPEASVPKRRNFWAQLGIGLALGVAVFFTVQRFLPQPPLTVAERLEQTCNETGVTCEPLLDANNVEIGTLAKRPNNTLFVVFNAPPPSGQVYQGWEIAESGIASRGTYEGQVLEITEPLATGSTFGVTLEPPGGSPQPTTTPIALYEITS
jgi:anti-sigma-K factor RskA